MSDLHKLDIVAALEGLKRRDFSSVELTQSCIKQMEKYKKLNCFITETTNLAIESAKEADKKYSAGHAGVLCGIPIGIKDLFSSKGIKTTAASAALENYIPPYESTVSKNTLDAGAVMLGKTNMDEFAMGSDNLTSYFGPVFNPWKYNEGEKLIPGGSSGGSAAAVAGFLAMAALGSDTGGSVRQPAALTGTVGFKPTYGRCSRYGMIAFASSLDQAGIITRSCRDAALMMEIMAGRDPSDSTSIKSDAPNLQKACNHNTKGMKIGVPVDILEDKSLNSEILQVWKDSIKIMQDGGAEIIDIKLPHAKFGTATYYVIAPAEASSNLARYDGLRYGLRVLPGAGEDLYTATRSKAFGAEVKRRIMIGTYVLSSEHFDSYYLKAQKMRRLIAGDFDAAFKSVDAILMPTAPRVAYKAGERLSLTDTYLNDMFTVPASIAGLPCISLPAGMSESGLPIGMQIIAPALDEYSVIRASAALEAGVDKKFIPQGF